MDFTTLFAAHLRHMRGGTLVKDIAEATGIHENTLRRWEEGKTDPQASGVRKLAEHFGCTADFLLGISREPERIPGNHWIIDLDVYENVMAGAKSLPGDPFLARPIPARARLVSSVEYDAIRAAIPGVESVRKGK